MADIGYFKVHRKIWENPIFSSGERFDRRSAWLYILSHANYTEGSFMVKGRLLHIQRGQLMTSIRYLSNKWHWDKDTVSRFLTDIETEKMITVTRTQNGTLITVRNYNKYQGSGDSDSEDTDTEPDTESPTNPDTGTDVKPPLLKNIKKNIKTSKEITRGGRVLE